MALVSVTKAARWQTDRLEMDNKTEQQDIVTLIRENCRKPQIQQTKKVDTSVLFCVFCTLTATLETLVLSNEIQHDVTPKTDHPVVLLQ